MRFRIPFTHARWPIQLLSLGFYAGFLFLQWLLMSPHYPFVHRLVGYWDFFIVTSWPSGLSHGWSRLLPGPRALIDDVLRGLGVPLIWAFSYFLLSSVKAFDSRISGSLAVPPLSVVMLVATNWILAIVGAGIGLGSVPE